VMNHPKIIDAHISLGPSQYFDIKPETVLELMDQNQIEKGMISPSDEWMAVDNTIGNQIIAKYVNDWPTRFMGYASVNPWYKEKACLEMHRALGDGLCAIKINPLRQGFILVEKICAPIFDIANKYKLIVYVVTGIGVLSMPLQLSEIARRYPEAIFIMGRSGWSDFHMMDFLPSLQQAPNIYVETAYNFPEVLNTVIRLIGSDRIVFTSDAPFSNMKLEIQKIMDLDIDALVCEKILNGNITRLLNEKRI
jgi:uncharacterized protein